jgi:DNA-directed RNA polymerase specialized sigma24 family protein
MPKAGLCISIMHIQHDPTRTVSTPHFTNPTLAGRQQTWTLLCCHGAQLSWLPRMLDAGMNTVPHAESVEQICAAPEFSAECQGHPYQYEGITITPSLALDALGDARRPLFSRYIQAQFRRLSGYCFFRNEQERLDARELLEDTFYALLPGYEVGEMTRDRGAVSWGWEAFLAKRLVWSVGSQLRTRGHRVHDDLDSEACRGVMDEAADPVRRADLAAVRELVGRVLSAQITTPLAESTYRGLVFGAKSYKEIAAELGCSLGTIGHRVGMPLIEKLQERLEAEGFGRAGKASFRRIRGPLAQAIPEDIFTALMSARPPNPSAVTEQRCVGSDERRAVSPKIPCEM